MAFGRIPTGCVRVAAQRFTSSSFAGPQSVSELAPSQLAPDSAHVLTDIEHEIEPAGEAVAGVCYPHQQFGLE
jgi:hypothetical protein